MKRIELRFTIHQRGKEAKTSKADTKEIALAMVRDGTIKSAEVEREYGQLVWSFDTAKPGTKDMMQVQIDAMSRKIDPTQIEKPKNQAREAAAEQAEKNSRGNIAARHI